MLIKINASVTLSTGESIATGAVISMFNENFVLSQSRFTFDLRAWRSQADMDAGKDHCYLHTSARVVNGAYTIPEADMDQAATDGHFGVIGTNHPDRVKDLFADLLGVATTDVEILSLV